MAKYLVIVELKQLKSFWGRIMKWMHPMDM